MPDTKSDSTSIETLERTKRANPRSLANVRRAVSDAFAGNSFEENAYKIAALFETWKFTLENPGEITNDIIENSYYQDKTGAQITALKTIISAELKKFQIEFSSMFARFKYEPLVTTRKSLNSLFRADGTCQTL